MKKLKGFAVPRNVITVLLALLVLAAGCGPGPAQPTEVPTPTPTEVAVEVPDDVRAARDAALAYISENYPDQAPAPGLTWAEEYTTPEGLVGWVTYEFRAEDWVVTIGTAVVPPEMRRYEVMVENPATGFWWEGRVDAEGQVAEGPEIVLTARDAALNYVIEHYPDDSPAPDLTWEGGRTTPEGLIGSETFQYTAQDWVVTISYPVVAPENVVYQIVVENPTTGFRWEGELDAERYLTETAAEDEYVGWKTYTSEKFGYTLKYPGDAEVMGPNLDESVQFVGPIVNDEHWPWFFVDHYDSDFYHPPSGTDVHQWIADSDVSYDEIGPEVEIAGLSTVHLIYNESPQAYASDDYYFIRGDQLFHITILHAGGQRDWDLYNKFLQGFTFTTEVAVEGQPVMCWYGRVDSTPEDHAIDRLLVLLPEEAFSVVGVIGADEAIEAEIEALRDSGIYAHFWGVLNCDLGCQLVVTRLRPEGPEGPFFDPDPVEGWEGTIVSNPPMAQFDDYFILAGSIAVRYGIDSADATIAAQLESLRDTGSIIRVWGQVTCPAIDFHGTLIQVTRLEVAIEAPAAGEGYEGWNAYTSAKFGYTLRYPGECTVMGSNRDHAVQFADVNKDWPVLAVRHYDSDFYHPPAGTDVRQWIAHYTYDEIDPEAEIAGLPAVHLIYEEGPGWEASDEYYFIRGDQLFSILILHSGGQQDWDLYNKFLQSFTFGTEVGVEGKPLTLEALKNAAYLSEWPADGVAQLVDGEYEEEIVPGAASKLVIVFYPDMYAFGDLDGDGVEDAAVVLATSGGGSGTFISLEAVINDEGTPHHVATAFLGDRVEINSVAIESGEITVDMVTHGPDDPLCCPTLEVTQEYELQGDTLVELSSEG